MVGLFKAVELCQKLIDCGSCLSGGLHCTSSTTYSVQLIYKDDTSLFTTFSFRKDVSDLFRSNSDEYLLEFWCTCLNKGQVWFVSKCLRKHGFASAWWPIKKNAFSHSSAEFLKLIFILQKLNKLFQLDFKILWPVKSIESLVATDNLRRLFILSQLFRHK